MVVREAREMRTHLSFMTGYNILVSVIEAISNGFLLRTTS